MEYEFSENSELGQFGSGITIARRGYKNLQEIAYKEIKILVNHIITIEVT